MLVVRPDKCGKRTEDVDCTSFDIFTFVICLFLKLFNEIPCI